MINVSEINNELRIWKDKVIVISCYNFHQQIMRYCDKHKIEKTFDSFLWHGYNGIISQTYRFLYKAPFCYLANSKAFKKFYNKIDLDFRNDIMTSQQLTETQNYIMLSLPLVKALKRIMKEDALYVYKNKR